MASATGVFGGFGAVEIFQALRDGRPRTRAELAALTGFSRGTVSARIDDFFAAGLISAVTDATSTGGRPPARVGLNAQARVVAAADFGATHAVVALIDLMGEVVVEHHELRPIADGPQQTLDWLIETVSRLLRKASRPVEDLISIGLGLPGPVEHTSGRPTNPPIMPGWDGYDVPGHLRRTFRVPVLVDNDVNVMALGEMAKGHPDVAEMLVVKVSTGIGSGIITGGRLQRGASGIAGDIGHISIPQGGDVVCRCGNTGCLEAVAGTPALIRAARAVGVEVNDQAELLAAARAGDLRVMRVIRDAGRNIGHVLNMCVSIINPALIVVGGSLAESNEVLLAGMREVVYARSMPLATQNLAIAPSRVGTLAGVIGAGIMAIDFALAPERMEADVSDLAMDA